MEYEASIVHDNIIVIEGIMVAHHNAFLCYYSYTRLPCAAHKVRLDSWD